MKESEPSVWKKVKRIFFAKDYVRHKFTGDFCTDYIEAEGSMFFDFDKQKWDKKYLDILGYRPTLTNCAVCHKDVRNDDVLFYSPSAGGTVCVFCPHGGSPVNKTALEAIRRMILLSDQDLKRIKMPESLQKDVLTLLNSSLEEILGADDKSVQYLYKMIDR